MAILLLRNSFSATKVAATKAQSLPAQAVRESPQGDLALLVGAISIAS